MARFFVEPDNIKGRQGVIVGPDVKHINKVLRLKEGDEVTLLDGVGNCYLSRISVNTKDKVICEILEKTDAGGEPPVAITLVQCLPKGDKTELIIQKGTELGIKRFIPLKCTRSVVKLDDKKGAERRKRWQRVALEAAKQCRRAQVPQVDLPTTWQQMLAGLPKDALLLMPYEGERTTSLKEVLSRRQGHENVYIIIGPEGGFAPEEVELACRHGVKTVSLGPRILRTETVGLTMAGVIMYLYGDLGGI
ncbi:16S rRNA (uracil(1498)-N(3))-methyltransferase [Desulfofalx alkaliphila]|uniref:16S rRNA (uracil(1498)-N(3))-methyltransferase n=1 Tax=Desulfofalx alkaliphila TaxID=105483 RepID=UPI0004E1BF5F|nr:16S rRNA (uracil(1498)-N(3))-methyltransferase [Desulfofalx alkaliphila]